MEGSLVGGVMALHVLNTVWPSTKLFPSYQQIKGRERKILHMNCDKVIQGGMIPMYA